jgi:hypothetical protein
VTDTEARLLRAVLESPGDDTPRLAYADWLDDNAGVVPCPICTGPGFPRGPVPAGCTKCRGSLEIPDDRRERAEFIRIQCELAGRPDGSPETTRRRSDLFEREGDLLWNMQGAGIMPGQMLAHARRDWAGPDLSAMAKTIPGRSAWTWSRGFISTVRAPLAVLAGEECYLCHAGLGDGHPPRNCPACSGTGRVPGIGRDLFGLQPVTRVDTDRLPSTQLINGRIRWAFWREHESGYESLPNITPVSRVPWQLLEYLDAGYESEAAARDALSAALVAHFREQCGLTPLV